MSIECEKWLDSNKFETPLLVLDLDEVTRSYKRIINAFKNIEVLYAIKANPSREIIITLNKLGSSFDAASLSEIKTCLELGVNPKKISYGNSIKKSRDILKAYELGIKSFVFDCEEELNKIFFNAPNADIFCRVKVSNNGSEWPLSKKFGCELEKTEYLISKSRKLNLNLKGLSFHVGSQQTNPNAWNKALKKISIIYKKLNSAGLYLDSLNIGGGFPIDYSTKQKEIESFSSVIKDSLEEYFAGVKPKNIYMEPGRYLVGKAGIIEAEVVLVTKRNKMDNINVNK